MRVFYLPAPKQNKKNECEGVLLKDEDSIHACSGRRCMSVRPWQSYTLSKTYGSTSYHRKKGKRCVRDECAVWVDGGMFLCISTRKKERVPLFILHSMISIRFGDKDTPEITLVYMAPRSGISRYS